MRTGDTHTNHKKGGSMFSAEELCMLREAIQTHVETMADIQDGAGAKPPWHTDPDEARRLAQFVELDQKIAQVQS